jgi:hypothetical protein
VFAGLGTVAGALGITWRSVAGSAGHVSLDLVRPLWEAQIDLAVAARLTPPPQRDYIPGLERPEGRWRRAWRELRTADPETPHGAVAQRDPAQPASAEPSARNQDDTGVAVLETEPGHPASSQGQSDASG